MPRRRAYLLCTAAVPSHKEDTNETRSQDGRKAGQGTLFLHQLRSGDRSGRKRQDAALPQVQQQRVHREVNRKAGVLLRPRSDIRRMLRERGARLRHRSRDSAPRTPERLADVGSRRASSLPVVPRRAFSLSFSALPFRRRRKDPRGLAPPRV